MHFLVAIISLNLLEQRNDDVIARTVEGCADVDDDVTPTAPDPL